MSPRQDFSDNADSRPSSQLLDECRRCDLWRHATHGVPGAGPPHAGILIVGEQPGDQEDLSALPFVGPAGKVLDHALSLAGLARQNVYITNAVKHFKWALRGKRRLHKTPSQQEVLACHYWLAGELADSQAKVIVALGATALKSIMQVSAFNLGRVLGEVLQHNGNFVIPTYHPSYLLRLRDERQREAALQRIVSALAEAKKLAAGKR